jgi:hypothetical protein
MTSENAIAFELVEDGAALEIDASGAYCSCKCPDDLDIRSITDLIGI